MGKSSVWVDQYADRAANHERRGDRQREMRMIDQVKEGDDINKGVGDGKTNFVVVVVLIYVNE